MTRKEYIVQRFHLQRVKFFINAMNFIAFKILIERIPFIGWFLSQCFYTLCFDEFSFKTILCRFRNHKDKNGKQYSTTIYYGNDNASCDNCGEILW